MITKLIQFLLIFLCFAFIFYNHMRISTIQYKNDELIADTKKKINALNTILLQKYEQKQNIDAKILKIIVDRLNEVSNALNAKDNDLQIEVDSLKTTLNYLQEQNTLFHEFTEESI